MRTPLSGATFSSGIITDILLVPQTVLVSQIQVLLLDSSLISPLFWVDSAAAVVLLALNRHCWVSQHGSGDPDRWHAQLSLSWLQWWRWWKRQSHHGSGSSYQNWNHSRPQSWGHSRRRLARVRTLIWVHWGLLKASIAAGFVRRASQQESMTLERVK